MNKENFHIDIKGDEFVIPIEKSIFQIILNILLFYLMMDH